MKKIALYALTIFVLICCTDDQLLNQTAPVSSPRGNKRSLENPGRENQYAWCDVPNLGCNEAVCYRVVGVTTQDNGTYYGITHTVVNIDLASVGGVDAGRCVPYMGYMGNRSIQRTQLLDIDPNVNLDFFGLGNHYLKYYAYQGASPTYRYVELNGLSKMVDWGSFAMETWEPYSPQTIRMTVQISNSNYGPRTVSLKIHSCGGVECSTEHVLNVTIGGPPIPSYAITPSTSTQGGIVVSNQKYRVNGGAWTGFTSTASVPHGSTVDFSAQFSAGSIVANKNIILPSGSQLTISSGTTIVYYYGLQVTGDATALFEASPRQPGTRLP